MEVKRAVLLGLSRCVQMPTEFLLTGLLWIEVKVGQIIESPSIARVRDTQPAKLNACAVGAETYTREMQTGEGSFGPAQAVRRGRFFSRGGGTAGLRRLCGPTPVHIADICWPGGQLWLGKFRNLARVSDNHGLVGFFQFANPSGPNH